MPELRRDPVFGYWTIVASERSRRPMETRPHSASGVAEAPCPFCEGHEADTTPEIYALRRAGTQPNTPGWDVRAFLSKAPILAANREVERYGRGLYDLMEGIGHHEILVESPRHRHGLDELGLPEIERVIRAYVDRINDLEKDERFRYVLLFKNHGFISGAPQGVIRHSRSQIIAMPITPKRVKEELAATKNYYERRERCVFCDILRQEAGDRSRLVIENPGFVVLCPFASRSPFEMWVLPKRHSADFGRLGPAEIPFLASILRDCLARLGALLDDPPYNLILHTAPYRHDRKGLQWKTLEEDYHWYLQISPHLTHSAGFEWGTGIHINPTPPEDAAELLREVPLAEA